MPEVYIVVTVLTLNSVCVFERLSGRVNLYTLLSADTQKVYSEPVVDLLTAQLVAALFCVSHRDGMLDQE